ncbi:MAG: response regulator, partial [Gammaproteobacteria bacterium]|nr:response regulator [Gammaproteobacteria bacterium]
VVGGYEDTWERVITVLEDITERRQNELALIEAKAEAENANQAKSQFLSSMSHELRTPLNAIMGFSQLFEYDQSLTQQQQSKAHEIYEAGSHLLSLVNGILDLSRIESGEFEISIEAVSLQEVVDDAAKWVADLASQKNISVEYDSEQLAGIIVGGDKLKLKQIFSNLLSNAVKYNRPEGSVSIIYEKMGERLRIGIKDTGPGIPEKLKDALFQPFNRLGAETSGIEGTGIGLVITRQLANKMNGQIDLDSIVGEGSTFWVELPLAEMIQAPEKSLDENATQASDVATKNPTDLERLKILVAEDNPVNRELLEAQLEVLQCSADYAENGAEALSLWQKDDYQILLTDIRMPIMDGYELTKRIRALEIESGKSSVIIAITANAMKDDIENCLASGANDVLNKPFSLDELEQILVKWVSTIVL